MSFEGLQLEPPATTLKPHTLASMPNITWMTTCQRDSLSKGKLHNNFPNKAEFLFNGALIHNF